MEQDVQQEVFKRLDALAEKMGVAAGQMWDVLVRQALIYGWLGVFVVAVLGVLLCFSARWVARNVRAFRKSDDDIDVVISVGATSVVFIVLCVVGYHTIPNMLNPEYRALQELLSVFK